MAKIKLSPTEVEARHLLEGTFEHVVPAKALADLSAEDALRRMGGYPHSIAELVSHMHFWQQRRLAFARGEDPGMDPEFKLGETDFEAVTVEGWPRLRDEFLASFDDLIATAADPAAMQRELFGERNVGFMLVSHACHSSYHLGQIVLMRIQQGNWVPEH